MWPSLVIGSILRDLEFSSEFLDTITADVPFELIHTEFFRSETSPIVSPIHAMLKLEMAGLWKIMGHPIIDMDASTASWFKKGTVLKRNLQPAAVHINNMFKKEFCRQFYKTHKKWPNLIIGPGTPIHITICYQANEWGETPSYKWDPGDFANLTLDKTFEFNFHVDTIDIISDKAIIPALPEWIHEYDSKAFRTLHGHFPVGPAPTTKSVVMHFLTSERFDCKEIINLIDQGYVPTDWRVMVAVPKEREFKEKDARCYGKMVPEMRAYQVVTEKNLADIIFRYVKHQSMTLSEEQLTKTLIRMSHPGGSNDYINIIIDFSSWCTHFRAELLEPLFTSLDRLFGFQNVYSFTHKFPLMSYLLFQDRYAPPSQSPNGTPEEGPRCVRGPEAWLEGLRQKGWTLATILVILRAAHMCDTTASLLGAGDNQVIVLRIPSENYLAERHLTPDQYTKQFLQVLERICVEAGIVIKVPESWRSRRLLEYGRKYFLDGVQVSSALKKVSRLTSEANQAVHTLNTVLAGLFSSGTAIAGDDITPIPAYMITVFESALTLWRHHPEYITMGDEWITTLLLMNRSIGGYPTVLFPQFALRATQDTLSLGLSVMKHLLKNLRFRGCVFHLLDITRPHRVDHTQLIKDPSSIPLNIPPQPENLFRRKLKQGLPDIVRNKNLAAVFSTVADSEEDNLRRDPSAIRPTNPKLMCKIWQLPNTGVREKVIGKFATSRSIQNASLGSWIDEASLPSTIKGLEVRTSRHHMVSKQRPFTSTPEARPCATVPTQPLRETLWETEPEGITMPTPADKLVLVPWSQVSEDTVPSSIMPGWSGSHGKNCTFERGPRTPYIGSQTRVRARRAILQVLEVGSMVENIKTILELHSWVKGSEGLRKLLETLIEEKTALSLEELAPYTAQVYSGMLAHRLPCPALRRGGMWNGCSNILSWITIISDTATHYAKKGINYNICFQEDFLYGLSVLAEMYREYGYVHSSMALVIKDKCCVWELPPETFTLEECSYSGLPLVHVISDITQVEDRHLVPTNIPSDPRLSYSVHTAHKLAAWVIHIKSEEFVTSLENRAITESLHASFLNLTEFKGVTVSVLIPCLVFYFMIYDRDFLDSSLTYFDDMFASKKTPYDVILDTMMACGKAGDLYSLTGLSASPREKDLRTALYLALTRCLDSGYLQVIANGAYLTPDNTERVYPRLVRLVLRLMREPSPPADISSYADHLEYMEALPPAIRRHIPHRIVHTEEESVSYIRSVPEPHTTTASGLITLDNPTGDLAPTPGLTTSSLTIQMAMPYEMSQLNNSLLCALQGWTGYNLLGIERVITLRDREGTTYNAMAHVLNTVGYPHWDGADSNLSVWERGPLSCATDPCHSALSVEGFLSSVAVSEEELLGREMSRPHGPKTLFVYTEVPDTEEPSQWFTVPHNPHMLLFPSPHGSVRDLDDPRWISLPSVIPPLNVSECPEGSSWILLGVGVEDSVCASEEMMSAYKQTFPGISPHLISTQTVIAWNSNHLRKSLLNPRACFNPLHPIIRVLRELPADLDSIVMRIREEILGALAQLKGALMMPQPDLSAAEEDLLDHRTGTLSRTGHRVYSLFLLQKVLILSDLTASRISHASEVHCHRHEHSFKLCLLKRCRGATDAIVLQSRKTALDWINANMPMVLMLSTIVNRLGSIVRYKGPYVSLRYD